MIPIYIYKSYVWLRVFNFSHRLLLWINYRQRKFLWELLSCHTEMISGLFPGQMCFLEESYKTMQKIQILKILRAPSIWIREYAFNYQVVLFT